MKGKIFLIIAILIVIASGVCSFIVYERANRGVLNNDGIEGVVTFEKIGAETGFGLNIDQGEFPINIELTKGKLNIKISIGDNIVFEENNIDESKNEVINISESGYYILTVSGKNATGTIKYPVTENSYTPGIVVDSIKKDIVYVGTDHNFKIYEAEVNESLSVEEKAGFLIQQISEKIGYEIIVNEITSGKGGMTIDLDSKSAPFDIENTYIGDGKEEYHTYAVDETTDTIFDSIIETLQNYFSPKMNVFICKEGKEVAVSDTIEEKIKYATEKYFEMVYKDKISDIKFDNVKVYEGQEKEDAQKYVDLAENDYAFEIIVELKPTNKDVVKEITDVLGEYNEKTEWIVEKNAYGVMRYNTETNGYDVTSITKNGF